MLTLGGVCESHAETRNTSAEATTATRETLRRVATQGPGTATTDRPWGTLWEEPKVYREDPKGRCADPRQPAAKTLVDARKARLQGKPRSSPKRALFENLSRHRRIGCVMCSSVLMLLISAGVMRLSLDQLTPFTALRPVRLPRISSSWWDPVGRRQTIIGWGIRGGLRRRPLRSLWPNTLISALNHTG